MLPNTSDLVTSRGPTARRRKWLALLVPFAFAVAACGSDDAAPAPAAPAPAAPAPAAPAPVTDPPAADLPPVKVGAILSTSGAYSQLGGDGEIALNAFAEWWRFADGRRIEFVIINDGSDPTQAVAAGDTLAAQDVIAIIGPSSGASMTVSLPVLIDLEIPILMGPPLPYPNFNMEPNVFSPNLHQVAPTQLNDFQDYLAALNIENPVVITNDDASGAIITKIWGSIDIPVELVPLGVTNYEPVLVGLRDNGHDAILAIGASGEPPAFIARAAESLGWDVPQFLAPSNLVEDYINLAGDSSEGALGFLWPAGAGSCYYEAGSEQAKAVEVIESVVTDVDLALHANIGYYWDHALAVALAVETSGSIVPADVRAVLENQEFWGVNGFNKRTPTDHVGYQRESSIQAIVLDGKIVPALVENGTATATTPCT